ncbi:MAG: 6-pyruvoyl tetrahydropterin synthase family protein [Pirellulaceae bacterium]
MLSHGTRLRSRITAQRQKSGKEWDLNQPPHPRGPIAFETEDLKLDNSSESYRVQLQKEQLVFSSAHFITFAGDICECLHGHNYGVKAEVCGPLDENKYVIDFIAFRDNLEKIVRRLDHHMLLPMTHPMIRVEAGEKEVVTTFREKRWVFPLEDCILLPITNTTAEQLAWWIGTELKKLLKPTTETGIESLEVAVDENNGQWGICKLPW